MKPRLSDWIRPPVFEDPEETRLAGVSHWIFTSTAAAVLGASVLALFHPNPLPPLLSFAVTGAVLLVSMWLVRTGRRDVASLLFLSVGWSIVTFNLVAIDGTLRSPTIVGYPLLVLLAGVLGGTRAASLFAGLGVLTTLAALALETRGVLPAPDPPPALARFWTGIALATFLSALIVVLVRRSVRSGEENRMQLEAQLQRSQRMEAVGRLAGGIAHDFNNYLTVILGNAEALAGTAPKEEELRESLAEIEVAAERSASLIRKLLAFSRSQPSSPRVIDPRRFLAEMDPMIRRIVSEEIELETIAGERGGNVRIDPAMLETSLINLAVNARDAMPRGGTLTIETGCADVGREQAWRLSLPGPGPHITIAVSDTGEGMSEATKSRLFEPFYTTKDQGRGTGLGLATVYGTVRHAGGAIEVESEPSRGTTFRIYLPRVDEPEERGPSEFASAEPLVGRETLMLVEDEDMVRSFMASVLRANGYTTLEAANGREGLELAKRHEGAIDLLVTDVIMPQMGGVELASRLVELRPDLEVLFVSGYTGASAGSQKLHETGGPLLSKPFTASDLLRHVHQRLHLDEK